MAGRTLYRRALRPTRRSLAVLTVAAAVALGACTTLAPAPSIPLFPGLGGTIEQYTGTECRTVWIAGDSMFDTAAPYLAPALAASGRGCATVENRSVPGASTGDWLDPAHHLWTDLLAAASPGDILILELIGNRGLWTGPPFGDPSWLQQNADNAQRLTDEALAAGLHVYWVIPPVSGMFCNFSNAWATNLLEFAGWISGTLPGLYPGQIDFIDWRFPFGGEHFSKVFTFDDGTHKVRQNDCVHFETRGNEVAADAAVLGIQHEWALPTPPASAATPSTTPASAAGSGAGSAGSSGGLDATLTGPGVEALVDLGFVGRTLVQAGL